MPQLSKNLEHNNSLRMSSSGKLLNSKGLTLIEMLLAVSLLSVLSVAIYQSFSNGIKVWDRAREFVVEEDISIFFDKLESDLNNIVKFSQIVFKGEEKELEFCSVVRTPQDPHFKDSEGVFIDQIGKVQYFYDRLKKGIYRRQSNYSESLYEKVKIDGRLMISQVEDLEIKYHFSSSEKNGSDHEGSIPMGIEVKIIFSDSRGKQSMERFYSIPLGN